MNIHDQRMLLVAVSPTGFVRKASTSNLLSLLTKGTAQLGQSFCRPKLQR